MKEIRENGKKALRTVLSKEKNVCILENNIFLKTKKSHEEYNLCIMQIIGEIIDGVNLYDILKNIKNNNIGWKDINFKNYENKIEEQNDFIENPFEVEEGVLECKCGSKRVFSYTRQTRSCDEPVTTFAHCMACKSKWTF